MPEKEPSVDDIEGRAELSKNVAIQKALVSKFPFVAEHHEQISLDEKINKWTAALQKVDNTPKPESNMFETDEDLNLNKLFKENTDLLDGKNMIKS